MDSLNVMGKPLFDDRITKYEVHAYNPYANASLGNNDEIRIPIQQQDLITLPSESYLYVEGRLVEGVRGEGARNDSHAIFDNNCVAFMFDEIRYELNGIEIDRCKNVGITTTIKNYMTLTAEENKCLKNAGWDENPNAVYAGVVTNFSFCVPLKMLLGFCEDYKRVIVNARHELVLIRARDDIAPIYSPSEIINSTIKLEKVQWRMPHISLNEMTKLHFLRLIEQNNAITMAFRSWDLYEYPLLPTTRRHIWTVKAATQLEKPRYVILALRKNKKTTQDTRATMFNHCNLTDVKLYLNSESYPYDRLNLDFESSRYSILYDMYTNFIKSYYSGAKYPMWSPAEFTLYGPIIPIDCSQQNDSIKSGTVDVKIEIECSKNIPDNTTAYCLIIHDRIVEYNPLTSTVRKLA